MADDVTIQDGTGNPVNIAADEIGGKQFQRVKLTWGVDGTAGDAAAANPLPVDVKDATTVLAALSALATDAVLQAVSDRLGDLTTPTTGSVNARLATVEAALGDLTTPTTGSVNARLATVEAALGPLHGDLTDVLDSLAGEVPTGTAYMGQVGAGLETGSIYLGATALTPKFATANPAASQTDSSVVVAVTAKKIRVLSAVALCGATATTLVFNTKGAGAGTAISPVFANAANGGEALPFSPVGWFETAAGEALTVTTGAGAATGLQVVYVEV